VTQNLPLDYATVIFSLSSEPKPKMLLPSIFLSGYVWCDGAINGQDIGLVIKMSQVQLSSVPPRFMSLAK